jgi:hypothetical protein
VSLSIFYVGGSFALWFFEEMTRILLSLSINEEEINTILCMIVLSPLLALAQKTITVSGYIKDSGTGEVIIAASVYNTNQKGRFHN